MRSDVDPTAFRWLASGGPVRLAACHSEKLSPQHLARRRWPVTVVLAVGVIGGIVAALGDASPSSLQPAAETTTRSVRHYYGDWDIPGTA